MKEIQLTKGYVALVDDEDYDYLSQHKWRAHVCKRTVYAVRLVTEGAIPGKTRKGKLAEKPKRNAVLMHRSVMDDPSKDLQIDHIDHNGLNNQKSNLRLCSRAGNMQNTRKAINKKTSPYKGVTWNKQKSKFTAQIRINGKMQYLGPYLNDTDAALAYNEAAKKHYGEFASLNQIVT
jgi:hypothetical protein